MPMKEKILKELASGPKKFKQLQIKFKASKKFFAAMDELYDQGIILENNGMIRLAQAPTQDIKVKAKEDGLLLGTVVKLTENFGFVRVEDMQKDVFVAGKFMKGAVVGDEVELRKIPSSRRDFEGEVVAITKEKKGIVASVIKKTGKTYVTLKDCPTLTLPVENRYTEAVTDDVVLVDLFGRGRGHRSLIAKITKVIGKISSSEKAVELLIAEKGVQTAFEPSVINEANLVISRIDMQEEYQHRTDLTDKTIFTIDSAKTKDIDDAISIEKTEDGGFRLGVHIADVSHFVRPASLCNKAAFERGTSIYYGETVIPMLPKEYSNDICSLNEKTPRLAFTCDMQLDKNGNVKEYKFYKSVINSRLKGVYSEINEILAGTANAQIMQKYAPVQQTIENAAALYQLLREKRVSRGSMDIESDEAQIVFDKTGKAVNIVKRERGLSEMIIEECMLLANSCSANLAKKLEIPFVYRTHEQPSPEKLITLKDNLKRFGMRLEVKPGESMQQAFSRLLDDSRNTRLQQFIHRGILRSQSKAKYSEVPTGHFGLALEDYAHFTSPIRRYPDLAIHRILTDVVNGVPKDKIRKKYGKFAAAASTQSSACELVAMQTERDATDIYKAEIMESHIGEIFAGIVTSVTTFGIYVTLENTIEGLVHISKLDMINPILSEGYSLSCPISGTQFVIGDTIDIKVASTDILNGNIDFVLAHDEDKEGQTKQKPLIKKFEGKKQENKKQFAPKERSNKKKDSGSYQEKPYYKKNYGKNSSGEDFKKEKSHTDKSGFDQEAKKPIKKQYDFSKYKKDLHPKGKKKKSH